MPEIAIVGEAWGEAEARERTPFVGAAGYELTRMLEAAGIARADCYLTNVFNTHPPRNDLSYFCGPKSDRLDGYPKLLKGNNPHFSHYTGDYVHARWAPELDRLGRELVEVNPNIVVCLGNTALWSLQGRTVISKSRGTTEISTHTASGFKCLGTYHPAAVLRQWDLRPVTILDLAKAKRESIFPDIRRPERTILIPETLDDLRSLEECLKVHQLSVDIETSGNQITCIGFSPSPNIAVVVPIFDFRKKSKSYWPTAEDERFVWRFISRILEDGTILKTFQNGLYDIAFLWRSLGIPVYGAADDTMLLHHALQPESLKGLGFLGSIYTDEGAWKNERHVATIKADE